IDWLLQQGVAFTLDTPAGQQTIGAGYHLSKEGGHSHRRVIHAADATGKAVFEALVARATCHPNIRFFTTCTAIDLLTGSKLGLGHTRCAGAYVLNEDSDQVSTVSARFTILATGGASKAYLYTSNPDGASGDGIAMAWRAS